ncbi:MULTISPECIES: hypothetical protein [Mycobacterium]|uniref:hypothetical protein n=1 Tax=Mycobacterium TaxID=1763 RepID=UPI0012E0F956|nr:MULTISPECIES: hypothetical protein [Mycobacterium]MDP7729448.1 hypothetical protein [Mycobacterium sp. TY813]
MTQTPYCRQAAGGVRGTAALHVSHQHVGGDSRCVGVDRPTSVSRRHHRVPGGGPIPIVRSSTSKGCICSVVVSKDMFVVL